MSLTDRGLIRSAEHRSQSAAECVYVFESCVENVNAVRNALEADGLRVRLVSNVHSLIHAGVGDSAACILIGDRKPAEDLPTTLADHGITPPMVLVSDRCDVNSVRSAFRRGVVDCLRGPLNERELLRAVRRALARDRLNRVKREEEATALRRLARLSGRESQVMAMACEGYRNREIALLIGVRPRTVEVHKAKLMEKLKVRTLAELIRVREHGATMPSTGRRTGACDCAKEFAPNMDVRPKQRHDRTA